MKRLSFLLFTLYFIISFSIVFGQQKNNIFAKISIQNGKIIKIENYKNNDYLEKEKNLLLNKTDSFIRKKLFYSNVDQTRTLDKKYDSKNNNIIDNMDNMTLTEMNIPIVNKLDVQKEENNIANYHNDFLNKKEKNITNKSDINEARKRNPDVSEFQKKQNFQKTLNPNGSPDLVVSSVEVLDATGPDISYRYTIKNQGTGTAPANFYNDIYLSSNTTITTSDYKIYEWYHSSEVAAGDQYTSNDLSTTVSGVPSGDYYLGVITDATNIANESNENNNTGYDPSPKVSINTSGGSPDLVVSSVEVLDATGPNISYRYTIKNQGNAIVSSAFRNDIYLSSNATISTSDYKIAYWYNNNGLSAGGAYTSNTLNTTVSGVSSGDYYLGVITDAGNAISESNENNNIGYDSSPKISINGSGGGPDLIVSSVEVLDAIGPDISYRYTIKNQGTNTAPGNFYNDIYLSSNTNITTSDYKIYEWYHSSEVAAGDQYTSTDLSTTVSGVPSGDYYLGVITDATNTTNESNENNNTGCNLSNMISYKKETAIESNKGLIPQILSLEQNFPNPFNSSTKIKFSVPKKSYITLKVYNLLGKEVKTLSSGYMPAGFYTIDFNAQDFPSGTYFYQISTKNKKITKKMFLLK